MPRMGQVGRKITTKILKFTEENSQDLGPLPVGYAPRA